MGYEGMGVAGGRDADYVDAAAGASGADVAVERICAPLEAFPQLYGGGSDEIVHQMRATGYGDDQIADELHRLLRYQENLMGVRPGWDGPTQAV